MTALLLVSMPVVAGILTGVLHRRAVSVWVATGVALVGVSSGLHLVAVAWASSGLHLHVIRAFLSDHQFWVSVFFTYVFPVCVTFGLAPSLPSPTPRAKVALGGFLIYVATCLLSLLAIRVGKSLGAFDF